MVSNGCCQSNANQSPKLKATSLQAANRRRKKDSNPRYEYGGNALSLLFSFLECRLWVSNGPSEGRSGMSALPPEADTFFDGIVRAKRLEALNPRRKVRLNPLFMA